MTLEEELKIRLDEATAQLMEAFLRLAQHVADQDGKPVDDPVDPVIVFWTPGQMKLMAVRAYTFARELLREPRA